MPCLCCRWPSGFAIALVAGALSGGVAAALTSRRLAAATVDPTAAVAPTGLEDLVARYTATLRADVASLGSMLESRLRSLEDDLEELPR